MHTNDLKVLPPLFGWGCGVSNLCWNSILLNLLWGVLRVNSNNTGSVLSRRAGSGHSGGWGDSAQVHWRGVCTPELRPCQDTRHRHLQKHQAGFVRGFFWIKPPFLAWCRELAAIRLDVLPASIPQFGQRRALQALFSHLYPHLNVHTRSLFISRFKQSSLSKI